MDLQLPMQSVHFTNNVVSSNSAHARYTRFNTMCKWLRQVFGFLRIEITCIPGFINPATNIVVLLSWWTWFITCFLWWIFHITSSKRIYLHCYFWKVRYLTAVMHSRIYFYKYHLIHLVMKVWYLMSVMYIPITSV